MNKVPIVVLIILVILSPLPTLFGSLLAIMKVRLGHAIVLALVLPLLLIALGAAAIFLVGPTGIDAEVIGAVVGVEVGFIALFTYLGYHFARELQGEPIL
jgi:hypothetical protein